MRVALNMLFVAPGLAGGRVYCEGLLGGLSRMDRDNTYDVYTRRDIRLPELLPERFRHICAPVPGPSVLWRTAWEYGVLPGEVRRRSADLFHGLGSLSPVVKGRPVVLTIHDLIYLHFPQSVPLGHRLFMRYVLPQVARRADRVIVPSHCTAREVVRHLGVRPGRLRLVHYGPGNPLEPVTDEGQIEAALKKFGVRRPYVISVGRAYPHKNIAGLLRAMARLRRGENRDVQLVLVGDRYRAGHELDRLVEELRLREGIVFTGFVSMPDLRALYSGAAVFAFPSLAEGYGLPILEAMSCGTPVAASQASAVPEAVGSAGLVGDAQDPEAFAALLGRVLGDEGLQALLQAAGRARVREFSWDRCARETLAVYRELS
jgi:glycosyltransferase involved in cell wall biosynthesis